MDWQWMKTRDSKSADSAEKPISPISVPQIDHDRIFKAYAAPSVPKVDARMSRTPAQDRLKRLQTALKADQKCAPEKHVVRAKTPPSVQGRLKLTPAPARQAPKRRAEEEESKEVPQKKRAVAKALPESPKRPKLRAHRSLNERLRRPMVRPACTSTATSAQVPLSPPERPEIPPNVIQPPKTSPNDTEYRVSVNFTSDNRLIIDYKEDKEPESSRIPDRGVKSERKDLSRSFYVVVDTNVFCHNLIFLENIINMHFATAGHAILLIPYIVLQELDNIKHRTAATEIHCVRAIKFINEKLEARHPQVKGQSAVHENELLIHAFSADDSIINCCLQMKEKSNRVILLSNDTNLRNKALCSGITSMSPKDLREDTALEFL
ncbi:uncharacterized protein LOC132263272 [Phlebotomus argentipes]|uniref:uncharacterized protein LOC132263272 n=1 Tax=Phlebotomus argentipes TaxID=94469 RepID=UPI0028933198|nr:uncharacterized protein LOC132263272 [Phlebotomus argentipes]